MGQGQGKVAPKPVVTDPQVCQKVVNDAATTPICPLTGSADQAAGTTPATDGTATTGGEKTSTDSSSHGSGSGKSSSSSNSSSTSQGSAKGGSDK